MPKEETMLSRVIKVITNRCLIVGAIVAILFYLLLARLFYLQLVMGGTFLNKQTVTGTRTVEIPASRGNIYDRLGRPLAINKSAYTVKMDANMVEIDAQVLYDFVVLMSSHGESIVDKFPITLTKPFEFDFTGTGNTERQWKLDMGFEQEGDENLTAEECFYLLRDKFKVSEDLPDSEARKVLNLCCMLYGQRYRAWEPITIAYDVDVSTLSVIEEIEKYAGISADVQSLRYYPEEMYFSHIIGTIGRISDTEYAELKDEYKANDTIGKSGIEKTYEAQLRGTPGKVQVEVNAAKQIIAYLPDEEPPVTGDSVYLTLDRDLQVSAYDILQNTLKEAIVNKLSTNLETQNPIGVRDLFASMIKGSVFDIAAVMESSHSDIARPLADYVLSRNPDSYWSDASGRTEIKKLMSEAIKNSVISPAGMLMIMIDQGIITGGQELRRQLDNHDITALSVVLDKLESGEITPSMTLLDPSTGSIVVTDVKNGNVLAAVGYPSYDNNEWVNNPNAAYISKNNEDPNSPLINRPFAEQLAPGSTLKMITAITALENSAITPSTLIYDRHSFTIGGMSLSCWSASSHGNINVSKALETSCNYFFAEIAYRLGNTKANTKLDGVEKLGEYYELFGLNGASGVELNEEKAVYMPTLEFKDRQVLRYNNDAPMYDREWHDGDTSQIAIGQGYSSFAAASMNKYILTLASRGTRYQLHLVDSVRAADGALVDKTRPVIEVSDMPISDSTWAAIYEGMLGVTEGASGTGRNVFANFPIRVAGKTGTAQQSESRNAHSSFGGFAPYEAPEIAIYVQIPFGDTKALPAIASQIAVKVMEVYFGLYNTPEQPTPADTLVP
ncbi:MAG: hypothetical protein LBL96_10415 [Clostridiales bacterium]|jgi:cell division protein FtsI/penicillin-binding protein 2|nr:hypothetical protein [Clostridiales bacterium]